MKLIFRLFFVLISNIALSKADCVYDVYAKSNYDIYDPTITLLYKSIICDCLTNIMSNTSDTSSNCNKFICAFECAFANINIVSYFSVITDI